MKAVSKSNRNRISPAVLMGALLWTAGAVRAAEWRLDVVDQSGTAEFTSIKADKDGNIHVAYIPDAEGHPLKYAYRDHATGRWFNMKVASIASFCTLTLDSKQRPHISYADHGTGLGAKLRHAFWDGSSWRVDPIVIQPGAVVAYYTSIALDANDNPFFAYYDYADPGNNFRLRMRSVFWLADHWEARTVDAQGGSGKFNAMAVDSKGRPHIAYANVKYESSSLRYASWTGGAWKTEVLEGISGPTPVVSVGIVMDSADTPHITYTLAEQRLVKYATSVAGQWKTEVIDAIQMEGFPDRNGIAVDSQGNPYVSYYDAKRGVLKIAFRQAGKWMGEELDNNFSGFTSSLAITNDTLWISYADELGKSLKVAHRPLQPAPASPATAVVSKPSSK